MQQALAKVAQAHTQAQDELKEQIESQRRAGNTAEADKLQQALDKLRKEGAREGSWSISRFKGLGEINPTEFKQFIGISGFTSNLHIRFFSKNLL